MNVVAFSLYGTAARYLVGAVENARLVRELYPGWEAHFWHERKMCDSKVAQQLTDEGAWRHVPPDNIPNGMFWRFLAHDLTGVERYIVRDVDSRIGPREVKAVAAWIASGSQLHVMRDHPFHCQAMMGGMWGWRKHSDDLEMAENCREMARIVRYGQDQDYLIKAVWCGARDRLVHDSCGTFDGTRNWPSDGPAFVGEYYDEFEQPCVDHRRARSNWIRKCEAKARQPA